MNSILQKIVDHKRQEIASSKAAVSSEDLAEQIDSAPATRNFVEALTDLDRVGLIAEVKKASPSKGVIRADFDPLEIAKTYARHGANCISVLTDENFFQGSLEYLMAIGQCVEIPLLRKDFILDEYQVLEARAAGADAVLLIAECLDPSQLLDLHQAITDLEMTALVELYEEKNLDAVLACDPVLVGVNNRDLNTFEVDLNHSIRVLQKVPSHVVTVSESGIDCSDDVRQIESADINAILVGESLMRSTDIGLAMEALLKH